MLDKGDRPNGPALTASLFRSHPSEYRLSNKE